MTFPEQKIETAGAYCDAYFSALALAQASVDRELVARAVEVLRQAYSGGSTIYACGNGGSASISNHLACDHGKLLATDTDLVPRVHSLATNIEVITAVANDSDYGEVFVHQLRLIGEPGDVLITVSSSGDSENIVRAAQWARDAGLAVIAMTGFSGGRSAELATVNLHVAGDNYGIIEDVHQSLMHLLAQYLRQERMSEELIAQRKF